MPDPTIAFADLETTGLDLTRHELWEIGLVLRDPTGDKEYLWEVRPDLAAADPGALRINRYYSRTELPRYDSRLMQPTGTVSGAVLLSPASSRGTSTPAAIAAQVAALLADTVLTAANVAFDAAFLAAFLRRHGQCPTWDHHLIEVESYAAGALGWAPPWMLHTLADALGVSQAAADRHTALGDALLVRDLYDAARARIGSTS